MPCLCPHCRFRTYLTYASRTTRQKQSFVERVKVNHISCLRPIIEVPRECRQPETSGNDISITNDSSTLFEVFGDSLPMPNIVNIFNNISPVYIVNIVNNINVVKNIN